MGLTTEGVFSCFGNINNFSFLFFFSSFLFFFLEVLGGGGWVSLIMGPSSTFHVITFIISSGIINQMVQVQKPK